jgi:hypothetical protein
MLIGAKLRGLSYFAALETEGTALRKQGLLKQCVDKGSHSRSLRENEKAPKKRQHNDNRQHPILLTLFHECP